MKLKKITAGLLAGMMVLSLAACGLGESQTTEENNNTEVTGDQETEVDSTEDTGDTGEATASGDISGTVVITGSTSVEKILTEMKDEFCAMYPNVTIEYTGSGSSAGIKDTKAGTNNIGASSR